MNPLKERAREIILRFRIRHTDLFDKDWYTAKNGLEKGRDPYRHYLEGGWRNSDPSPYFSHERYLEVNYDIRISGVCPLAHYLLNGKKEKRQCFIGQVPGKRWRFPADSGQIQEEGPEKTTHQDRREKPLVSVIIPTYNRAGNIAEACESVLNQTYGNLEVIVVDDCSADHTEEVIRSIKDPRLHYIRLENNLGACRARNRGIAQARGKYIAFQDSDDLWAPEKLEIQMDATQESRCDICFCRYLRDPGKETQISGPPYYYEKGPQNHLQTVFGIGTQTLLIRREALETERFDPEMPRFQELELLLRLAGKYRMYYCDRPLVIYRLGSDSISKSPDRLIRASELLLEKHSAIRREYPLLARELASLLISESGETADREKREKMQQLAVQFDHSRCMRKMIREMNRP